MALNSRCKVCRGALGPEDNDGANTQPDTCAGCRARAAKRAADKKSNGYAQVGRMRKAIAMVAFIDAKAVKQGLSPYDQAGRILLVTREWDDSTWETIGVGAGYKPKAISEQTRELVRDVYRSRANAPVDQQVAS